MENQIILVIILSLKMQEKPCAGKRSEFVCGNNNPESMIRINKDISSLHIRNQQQIPEDFNKKSK